jgi:putative flippase GtrA
MDYKKFFKEYYKYCIIGFIVTGMDFGILAVEVELLHIHYLVAAMVSYIITAIIHYLLCIKYVFTDTKQKQDWKALSIFVIIGIISLGIYELLMWIFVDLNNIHYLIAKIFATGITFSINFIARKFILFR